MSDGWGVGTVGDASIEVVVPGTPGTPPTPGSPGGCTAAICGITDSFNRTGSTLGTSDAGFPWTLHHNDPANSFTTDGTEAVIVLTDDGGSDDLQLPGVDLPRSIDDVVSGTVDFWFDSLNTIVAPEFVSGDFGFQAFIGATGSLQLTAHPLHSASVAKTDWVTSTWYRMRFLYDHANDIQAIKVWERANPEPGAWNLSRSTATDTWRVVVPAQLIIALQRAPGIAPCTYKIDNLDIAGVNRCAEFRFDNFNRTIADGWGTSDAGLAWQKLSAFAGGTAAVNGSAATIVQTSGSPLMYFEGAGSPVAHPAWTMRARFKTGSWSGTNAGFATTYFESDAPFRRVRLKAGSSTTGGGVHGQVQVDNNTAVDFPWVADTWYQLRWDYSSVSGLNEVRVYLDGAAEPVAATAVGFDATGDPTGNRFYAGAFLAPGMGTYTHTIDSIDFVYDGKPCYRDCSGGGSVFDSFTRTVTDDWGTSDGGFVWGDAFGAPASGVHGVSGGEAYADLPVLSGITKQVTGGGPWTAPGGFVMTALCSVLDIIGSGTETIGLNFYVESADFGTVDVEVANNAHGTIDILDATSASTPRTSGWTTGQFYVRWERRPGGVSRARVWAVGDVEPSTWDTEATAAADIPSGFDVDLESHTSSIDPARIRIDSIAFSGGCVDVLPAPASPGDPGTPGTPDTITTIDAYGPLGVGVGR